eukprot:TRINITY_DN6421_c0_g1_i1.p1 TRINITY_DN6421_c0_g1~~TRINITY_DN6421_c0_g1_i1.p1  ORF type:complete len:815 (+),score=143.91 TRINITY_DN6421_c0_g1_i1:98-2446(+)
MASATRQPLLRVQGGKLTLADDAATHLDGQEQLVRAVSIVGSARQGKSTLLNCLAGSALFSTSAEMDACTEGADVGITGISVRDWAEERPGGRTTTAGDAAVLLVDIEGQGVHDGRHDTLLATPLLLVSHVVLYNWQGRPRRMDTLNDLALLKVAAERVSHKKSRRNNVFGTLIIVYRDLLPCDSATADECRRLVFDLEDPKTLGKGGTAEAKGMKERNELRQLITGAFSDVLVVCLPPIHPDMNSRAIAPTEITPEFCSAVKGLQAMIARCLTGDSTLAFEEKNPFTGRFLANTLAELVTAINEGADEISAPSMLDAIYDRLLAKARDTAEHELATRLASELREIREGALSLQGLEERQSRVTEDIMDLFTREGGEGIPKSRLSRTTKQLRQRLTEACDDMERANGFELAALSHDLNHIFRQHLDACMSSLDGLPAIGPKDPRDVDTAMTTIVRDHQEQLRTALERLVSEELRDDVEGFAAIHNRTLEAEPSIVERKIRVKARIPASVRDAEPVPLLGGASSRRFSGYATSTSLPLAHVQDRVKDMLDCFGGEQTQERFRRGVQLMESMCDDPKAQVEGCQALSAAAQRHARKIAGSAGACHAVNLAIIHRQGNRHVAVAACTAISILAEDSDNKTVMGKTGVCDNLLELAEATRGDGEAADACFRAMANLVESHQDNCIKLGGGPDGAKIIVQALCRAQGGTIDFGPLVDSWLSAVQRMVVVYECKHRLRSAGLMAVLADLKKRWKDDLDRATHIANVQRASNYSVRETARVICTPNPSV